MRNESPRTVSRGATRSGRVVLRTAPKLAVIRSRPRPMLHSARERRHGRDAVDVEPRDEADGQRDGGEGEGVHRMLRGGGLGLGKELGEGADASVCIDAPQKRASSVYAPSRFQRKHTPPLAVLTFCDPSNRLPYSPLAVLPAGGLSICVHSGIRFRSHLLGASALRGSSLIR